MKKIFLAIFFISAFFNLSGQNRNFFKINSLNQMFNLLKRKSYYGPSLTAVLFHKNSNDIVSNDERFEFQEAGTRLPFVNFIDLNLLQNNTDDYLKLLDLKKLPAIVLYKNGEVFVDENNKFAIKYENFTPDEIIKFIDYFFYEDIIEIQDKLESEQKAFWGGENFGGQSQTLYPYSPLKTQRVVPEYLI